MPEIEQQPDGSTAHSDQRHAPADHGPRKRSALPAPPSIGDQVKAAMTRPHYTGKADAWRDVYHSADPFGRRIQRRRDAIVAAVQKRLGDRPARILDAGCGTGEIARLLSALGHKVVAVDRSVEMVSEGRQSNGGVRGSTTYLQGDIARLPFQSASFDVVVCAGVLGYLLPRWRRGRLENGSILALRELMRVLKEGGFLVVSASNLIRLHWLLDPRQLRRALKQRQRLRRLEEPGTESTGATQPGQAAVEPWWTQRWTPGEWKRLLTEERLRIVEWSGIGFGPFSFLGRHLFSPDRSVLFSIRLEEAAKRRGLRWLSQFAATWLVTLISSG